MDVETWSNVIQVAAVFAALAASVIALIVATVDRRHARRIAEEDRAASLRQARLLFEWDAAKRLTVLEARGGHTDPVIRKDMGAESMALAALLGPERLPNIWARRVGKSDEELRAFIADEDNEQFLRDAVEAERAMVDISREIRDIDTSR